MDYKDLTDYTLAEYISAVEVYRDPENGVFFVLFDHDDLTEPVAIAIGYGALGISELCYALEDQPAYIAEEDLDG